MRLSKAKREAILREWAKQLTDAQLEDKRADVAFMQYAYRDETLAALDSELTRRSAR